VVVFRFVNHVQRSNRDPTTVTGYQLEICGTKGAAVILGGELAYFAAEGEETINARDKKVSSRGSSDPMSYRASGIYRVDRGYGTNDCL